METQGETKAQVKEETMELVKEEKMEVGAPPDQNLAAPPPGTPAMAGGEVKKETKMELGEGSTADQKPAAPPPSAPAPAGCEVMEEEGGCLVGYYVGRSAAGRGRILLGKVASYDAGTGMYGVMFEDGQGEDLGLAQLREILQVADAGASGMKMSCRKRKLDLLVSSGATPEVKGPPSTRQRAEASEASVGAGASGHSRSGADLSDDAESSSNSSDSTKELPAEPCPQVQGPELPPSSGDIAVPEESISYLFSVYNFLRSFSIQLFLSPFGLDDFVGSLNCTVQNSLFDAVHVSLMRALKRHLETSSSEGSELASKCLRYQDWALLDALTWPAFLLEYLYVMGYIKDLGGQSFGTSLSTGEYYKLPVFMKLRILQILCDHVIDSDELKTELEAREGFNEEMEHSVDSSLPSESGARALFTRSSKPSACKNIEDLQKSENPPSSKVTTQGADVSDVSQDGNSDDCRICGMDGTLVCCDGCPSAYHSRCIGLNKAFLPQGLWFCPECAVNKLGPTSSRIERGARGAEIFGIDMCGRLFLGSCNYLLVIGTSSNAEPYSRYYNQDGVVKVLKILTFSDAYAHICRRIVEYWGNLLAIFHTEKSDQLGKGVSACHTPYSDSSASINHALKKAGDESAGITIENGGDSKIVILSQKNGHHELVAKQFTANSVEQAERLEEQKCNMTTSGAVTEKKTEVSGQNSLTQNNVQNFSGNAACGVIGISSIVHQSLKEQLADRSMVADMSNIRQTPPARRLIAPDLLTCGSRIDNGMSREDMGSTIHSAKADSSGLSYESKHPLQLIAEKFGNMSGGRPTKVSSFKPQGYVNLYNHGDIAASAAANLAVLTSDEGKVPESHVASNPRKKLAVNIALQMKAFSSAAAQFVWPSSEKKLMEVPRERCGWCIACKSSAGGNKRGCFLNLATANAIKGSARHLSALRLIKNGESHLPSIVAYLANMEESLHGLLVGPLQDVQYKQRWHKQLREASNCRMIKLLLLELESNIRGIAFSGSWLKLIDDWVVESSGVSGGASRVGANQKHGTGGRRGRKRSLAPESATTTNDDNSWKKVNWWCGGKISKIVLQRGSLLSSVIRKAARQGGIKRISGVSYPESSGFPRRTRQFAWRASVGLSRNSSQLALQVRYLDAHIRWREFIAPDQIPSDGKGSDADFSAFRNAVVCDKKIVDNKIRYALKFSNQKHLPVRVTKNILEAEDNQDGNGKLWFSENRIPLYLIREFEEKAGVGSSPIPGMSSSNCFTNFHQRRIKASYGNVFSYLLHRGDVFPCSSCKRDVPFRDAVKCSSCQGTCHEECTSRSVANKGGNSASDLICKLCLAKRAIQLANYNMNASYHLPQQKSNSQQVVTVPKIIFRVGSAYSAQPVAKMEAAKVEAQPVANVEAQPETKPPPSKSEQNRKRKKTQEITYFGLLWKKKKDQTGGDFRRDNIILKSKDGTGSSIKPTCCLCEKPYRPDLMYIRCEKCMNWFHGDALQLEEAKIFELAGYRCCRCRRRAIPPCPYSDNYEKPEPESISEENAVTMSSQSTIPQSISSEEGFGVPDEDPLLSSYGRVKPIGEQTIDADLQMNMANFVPGSNQKLSVRRAQFKNAEYLETASLPENAYYLQNQSAGCVNTNFSDMNEFSASEANYMDASELLEWDVSQRDAYGVPATDDTANCQWNDPSYGNIANEEYEPQTYFSFTELLASEDTQLDNPFEMSTGIQEDGYCTGNFDQHRISFDEMSRMVEDGSSNMHFPTNESSFDGVACHKCKLYQPPPDLKCQICGLHVHPHCSPWVESEQLAGSANWRCGACREWR